MEELVEKQIEVELSNYAATLEGLKGVRMDYVGKVRQLKEETRKNIIKAIKEAGYLPLPE